MPGQDKCSDCVFYEAIDSTEGKCKVSHPVKQPTTAWTQANHIGNGFPHVKPDENACGDFA